MFKIVKKLPRSKYLFKPRKIEPLRPGDKFMFKGGTFKIVKDLSSRTDYRQTL